METKWELDVLKFWGWLDNQNESEWTRNVGTSPITILRLFIQMVWGRADICNGNLWSLHEMNPKIALFVVFIIEKTRIVSSLWLFSCPRGNRNGMPGDECSAFCQCKSPFVCEAFRQRCTRLSNYKETCHLTKPCERGLSCQPGIQRCFNAPRQLHEPCSLGFRCASGLSCAPGFQQCFNHPRLAGQPCSAGYPCKPGLSCHPGVQRCYHTPRDENEPCSLGFGCPRGLTCSLCGGVLATCQLSQVPAFSEQVRACVLPK